MFSSIRSVLKCLHGPNRFCRRSADNRIEGLEARTLLASLISSTKVTYKDTDGDDVSVTFSKPFLTQTNVNSIFHFDIANVGGSNAVYQQLKSIDLMAIAGAAGTTITTIAVRDPLGGGNGIAALGQINATGLDIGAVTLDGDLGRILAGDSTLTSPGGASLKVQSVGRYGLFTGVASLSSIIQGKLGSLTTKTDLKDAEFQVNGSLGAITIGGSLIGGSSTDSGLISSTGEIGPVTIGGDIAGGTGEGTGKLFSNTGIASVTLGGSSAFRDRSC